MFRQFLRIISHPRNCDLSFLNTYYRGSDVVSVQNWIRNWVFCVSMKTIITRSNQQYWWCYGCVIKAKAKKEKTKKKKEANASSECRHSIEKMKVERVITLAFCYKWQDVNDQEIIYQRLSEILCLNENEFSVYSSDTDFQSSC